MGFKETLVSRLLPVLKTFYNKHISIYSIKIKNLWLLNTAVAEMKYMYKDNDDLKV